MPLKLVVHNLEYSIESDCHLRIGRGDQQDIVIPNDPLVSSHHAVISNGEIIDKQSTNGVFINNQKLSAGEKHRLIHNDIVTVGQTQLYVIQGKPYDGIKPSITKNVDTSIIYQTNNNNNNNNTDENIYSPSYQHMKQRNQTIKIENNDNNEKDINNTEHLNSQNNETEEFSIQQLKHLITLSQIRNTQLQRKLSQSKRRNSSKTIQNRIENVEQQAHQLEYEIYYGTSDSEDEQQQINNNNDNNDNNNQKDNNTNGKHNKISKSQQNKHNLSNHQKNKLSNNNDNNLFSNDPEQKNEILHEIYQNTENSRKIRNKLENQIKTLTIKLQTQELNEDQQYEIYTNELIKINNEINQTKNELTNYNEKIIQKENEINQFNNEIQINQQMLKDKEIVLKQTQLKLLSTLNQYFDVNETILERNEKSQQIQTESLEDVELSQEQEKNISETHHVTQSTTPSNTSTNAPSKLSRRQRRAASQSSKSISSPASKSVSAAIDTLVNANTNTSSSSTSHAIAFKTSSRLYMFSAAICVAIAIPLCGYFIRHWH